MSAPPLPTRPARIGFATLCGLLGYVIAHFVGPSTPIPTEASGWLACLVALACGLVGLMFAPRILAWQRVRNVIFGLGVVLVPLFLILAALPAFV